MDLSTSGAFNQWIFLFFLPSKFLKFPLARLLISWKSFLKILQITSTQDDTTLAYENIRRRQKSKSLRIKTTFDSGERCQVHLANDLWFIVWIKCSVITFSYFHFTVGWIYVTNMLFIWFLWVKGREKLLSHQKLWLKLVKDLKNVVSSSLRHSLEL